MLTRFHGYWPRVFAWAGGLCLLVSSRAAKASGAYEGCWTCAVWLPVGLNLGAATHPDDGTGLLIGGEVSLVDLREGPFIDSRNDLPLGGYIDGLRDLRTDTWRFSVGPETVLYPLLGLDAGIVLEMGGEDPRMGMRVRYYAASVILLPYFGVEYLFSGGDRTVIETGALLKFPFLPES